MLESLKDPIKGTTSISLSSDPADVIIMPFAAVSQYEVTLDNVYLPLQVIAKEIDPNALNCKEFLTSVHVTFKSLNRVKSQFTHIRGLYDASTVNTCIGLLNHYHQQQMQEGYHDLANRAKTLATALASPEYLADVIKEISFKASCTKPLAEGTRSTNVFYQGRSFKPVDIAGWDKPFKTSKKYQDNPIEIKPYVPSYRPSEPVVIISSESQEQGHKRRGRPPKNADKLQGLPIRLKGSHKPDLKQIHERRAARIRKILNSKVA